MPGRWWRASSTDTDVGSPGATCQQHSGCGRRSGVGMHGWLARESWDVVQARLHELAVTRGLIDWSVSVDPTIAPAHQHATNVTRLKRTSSNYKNLLTEPPDHAIGCSWGGLSTKTHQLVEGPWSPARGVCTSGQDCDSPMFVPLMENVRVGRRARPDAALGDKAYSSRGNRSYLRCRCIEPVILEPRNQQGHWKRRGAKGEATEVRAEKYRVET